MRRFLGILALLMVLVPHTPAAAAEQSFTDPFAYCAAVGDIDRPDQRWTGEQVPLVILQGLQKALGTPSAEGLSRGTFWRCMGGKVYACNVGANIPCEAKANTSRQPTPAMDEYCRANPDSPFIPMYVRDRASIYDWACHGRTPAITRQLTKPDARGFLTAFWYPIEKSGGTP